ncbi:hypothetical protein SAMN04487983_10056 [Streptomyces sp. yr375]|uniref:Tat pathway signal sequence domain protein n=1 Tax=Streptomyces sp. yr375 TaxID=1761906 RepID=UPI0008CF1C43|nr:Tat pathway signal sequence domain protein [Streptomyces sp. yr375]SEQ40728.1 hypothetical protein SAMN04487983_10056 [Streptomyces sp. yr375]
MSGIGPVEPGEGTQPGTWEAPAPADRPGRRPDSRPLARRYAAHRRPVLAALAAALLLAGGGYLYATRPHSAQPAPPVRPFPSLPPFPSQVVDVSYLGEVAAAPGTGPRSFAFEILLGVTAGPPVTVTRVSQPYAGLTLTTAPAAPFGTPAGSARTIMITMHVTECGKVPGNAGLPFLDVTLRNTRAIRVHSFILGTRYAQDLATALKVACSNNFRNHQNV